jgi:D-lactate dehydrogenase
VILSPHTAFYTDEDVASMVRGVFESADAFAKGEDTWHEVKAQ